MYCKVHQTDHPDRVSTDGGRIIHAARRHGRIHITACGHYTDLDWIKRRKTLRITCKNCSRALGFDIKRQDNVRYLIYDKTTKLFFLRRDGGGIWIEEAFGATRWRNQDTAEATRGEILSHRGWGAKMTVLEYIDRHGDGLVIKKARLSIEIVD